MIGESMPMLYFRLIFSNFYPLAFIFIFVFGTKIALGKNVPYGVTETALSFIFLFQQTGIISMAIDVASCRIIGDKGFIKANVAYECNTYEKKNSK
jgi:hypothetical protein